MLKNISKKIKYFILPLLLLLFCFPVLAENFFESETGLKNMANETGYTKQKIFNSADSINTSVGGIIQLALSLTGLVFMIFIFYGGILWMTAAGTEKRIDRAKKIMSESIIGLLIVFLAYAITFFIINVFSGQKLLD